jgi:cyclic-di-AMP phosphodiesterase PgpH
MTESTFRSWLKRVGLTGGQLQRLMLLLVCFTAVIAILYCHLIIWPQAFHEGQVAPYTIFAPVMFVYEDTDLLASMSGGGQGVQWAVDFSRKQEALDRLDVFCSSLRKLRQQYLHAQPNDPELKGRTSELADATGVDLVVILALLRLDDAGLRAALDAAKIELAKMMDGTVSDSLLRQLKQGLAGRAVQQPLEIYTYFLQPNLVKYEPPELTEAAKRTAQIPVDKGSVIVAEGQVVDSRVSGQLRALEPHMMENQFLRLAGLGLIFLSALLMWRQYTLRFAPHLVSRPGITFQLSTLFVIFLLIGLLIGRLPFNYFFYAVSFAVATAATIVVLVYDAQFAIYFALGLGLVLSMALSYSADLTLYTLASAMLPTALLAPDSKRQTQVLFAVALGLFNIVLAAVVILVSVQTLHWESLVIAFTSGLAAGIVALGLLPVLETLTSQLTPGKLVELANPENELLKRLKREAHGTYAHSVLVADLAEEACRSIGARALLAKVGALYHDIGKLRRPGFFSENIHDLSKNPHQGLPPDTSVKILREHVTDGLNMARDKRLPADLHCFIAEHHGTYLIKYFYYHALRLHQETPDKYPEPQVENFSYQGPTPHSRETGIVMLADITEAMLRARPEAPAAEVRQIINGIVTEKITEGQLTHSRLTLGELEQVKAAFAQILLAQRHNRVTYPGKPAAPVHFHFMGREIPTVVSGANPPE